METHIHSYPKVYAIGHPAIAELFLDDVLVEEKVDGSQFSFVRTGSDVNFRSRGTEVHKESAGMFSAGVNAVLEIAEHLKEGWIYRGEYVPKPKQNVLCYGRIPKRTVILFDINTGDEMYLSRAEKEHEAERLGFELVPILKHGKIEDVPSLLALLENDSILGEQKVEGIVVKNYGRFGRDKKCLMGKYVREDFKEKHAREWKSENPTTNDVLMQIIASLATERRWEKSVERLRDAGKLEHSPRDIGVLIKEVQEDVWAEEKEWIAEKFLKWSEGHVRRGCTRGLPEWYKRRLLNSAFESDTSPFVEPTA